MNKLLILLLSLTLCAHPSEARKSNNMCCKYQKTIYAIAGATTVFFGTAIGGMHAVSERKKQQAEELYQKQCEEKERLEMEKKKQELEARKELEKYALEQRNALRRLQENLQRGQERLLQQQRENQEHEQKKKTSKLITICDKEDIKALRQLQQGKQMNNRKLPHNACKYASKKAVEYIVGNWRKIDRIEQFNTPDWDSITPFHLACKYASVDTVKYLLSKKFECGIDVNATNNKGENALHYACQKGRVDVVKCLLAEKDNLGGSILKVDQKTQYGLTPLHLACKEGHLEVVKELLRAGADKNKKTTSKKMFKKAKTPLELAKKRAIKDLLSR